MKLWRRWSRIFSFQWRIFLVQGEGAGGRGFALIIVLWALVLLTVIGTQLTSTGRAEARLASNLRGAAVAQAAADGCVYQTVEQLLAGEVPWPPGPPRTVRVAGAVATIGIGSEDGKFDLNTIPADVLEQLLRASGASASDARQLAIDIVLWRFPSAETNRRAAAYSSAGLTYTPPGAAFQSVSELSLVLGMTPDLLGRLRPHVTVFHEGDPDPRFADPVVREILRQHGGADAVPAATAQPVGTADITVEAAAAGGSRASRHAIVRLGSGSDQGGWKILVWD